MQFNIQELFLLCNKSLTLVSLEKSKDIKAYNLSIIASLTLTKDQIKIRKVKMAILFNSYTALFLVFIAIEIFRKSEAVDNYSRNNYAEISKPNDDNTRKSSERSATIRPFRIASQLKLPDTIENVVQLKDYDDPIPKKVWIPTGLDFSCKGRAPGYYTDPSPLSKCQVYHMCMPDGRKYSMLCGIGTIFNQITFVCDHWYNYKCSEAENDYQRNHQLWDELLSPKKIEDEVEYEYDLEPDSDTTVSSHNKSK